MSTLIHAVGHKTNKVYRVYGTWGERRLPEIKSKEALYTFLAKELGLKAEASRKDIVFALMDKSWDGSRWVDDFRTRLKAARRMRDLTQAKLAERAGLSLEFVRALEQGSRRPGGDTLRRLAVALGVGVDDLLSVPIIDPKSETHEVLFS